MERQPPDQASESGAPELASSLTLRSTLVGIVVGSLICLSNTYFGLLSGFTTIMMLPSTVLGFAFFKMAQDRLHAPFTPAEHATLVVTASSLGVMPFTIGAVGVLPAMEFLTDASENGPFRLDWASLLVWSVGVSVLGVVVTLPLRQRFLVQEPMPFPFGTSSAAMIGSLHRDATIAHRIARAQDELGSHAGQDRDGANPHDSHGGEDANANADAGGVARNRDGAQNNKLILLPFLLAALYSVVSYFIPQIRHLPVFGTYLAREWLFSLSTSPGYISIGLIVPPVTTFFMVVGCLLGWGVLAPIAKANGWAPGPVGDWETGASGWIMWIAVALILGDAAVTISTMLLPFFEAYVWPTLLSSVDYLAKSLVRHPDPPQRGDHGEADPLLSGPAPPPELRKATPLSYRDDGWSSSSYMAWLVMGLGLCLGSMLMLFRQSVPLMALVLTALVIFPLSLVSIRCYGETGVGGTASISKIPQLLIAFLIPYSNPNAILLSLAVAGVVEAGVWQAAEMMDEFKMGHLVDAPPRSLFYAQLVGSLAGSLISVSVYRLYTVVFDFPSDAFPMPSAHIWISTARLAYGRGLPPALLPFGVVALLLGASFRILKNANALRSFACWVPSNMALAAGLYVLPDMIMAQAVGGLVHVFLLRHWGRARESRLIAVATGFILGQGLFSLITMLMQSFNVPHLLL